MTGRVDVRASYARSGFLGNGTGKKHDDIVHDSLLLDIPRVPDAVPPVCCDSSTSLTGSIGESVKRETVFLRGPKSIVSRRRCCCRECTCIFPGKVQCRSSFDR